MNIEDLDSFQKVEILKFLHSSHFEQLQRLESSANRIALSVGVAMVGGPLALKKQLGTLIVVQKIGISVFLIGAALSVLWLIWSNRAHCMWLQRSIVRIQFALGQYRPDVFFSASEVESENIPVFHDDQYISDTTLLSIKSADWGTRELYSVHHTPYVVAILLACGVGILLVLS